MQHAIVRLLARITPRRRTGAGRNMPELGHAALHAAAAATSLELAEPIAGWETALGARHRRSARHCRRAEARIRARHYLARLLSRVERKNGWQRAEAMGEDDPPGGQQRLTGAR